MNRSPDKSLILAGFKSQLKQFLDDLLLVFPTDVDVRTGANALSLLIKTNPVKVIEVWRNRIVPYSGQIEGGEVDFFLNKNYDNDINMASKSTVLSVIERLRAPVQSLGPENKNKTMKYLQNLTQLTQLYYRQVTV